MNVRASLLIMAVLATFVGCATQPDKPLDLTKTQASIFIPPTPETPPQCAAFYGVWTGNWSGYGRTWLWVVEVDSACVAKCISWTTADFPRRFQRCAIKNGTLEREKAEGMEYYDHSEGKLFGRYVSTSGVGNSAAFHKVPIRK